MAPPLLYVQQLVNGRNVRPLRLRHRTRAREERLLEEKIFLMARRPSPWFDYAAVLRQCAVRLCLTIFGLSEALASSSWAWSLKNLPSRSVFTKPVKTTSALLFSVFLWMAVGRYSQPKK